MHPKKQFFSQKYEACDVTYKSIKLSRMINITDVKKN